MYIFDRNPEKVARIFSEAGHSWQFRFPHVFNKASINAKTLGHMLNLPPKHRRIKRAIKSNGRAGLRPDEQRVILGIR